MICAHVHAVYAQNERVILCSKSIVRVITSIIIIQTIHVMSRDLWLRTVLDILTFKSISENKEKEKCVKMSSTVPQFSTLPKA